MRHRAARISQFIQSRLHQSGRASVTAVEAGAWLDTAGILRESRSRPGKPLRDLLRAGLICGQRQEANRHWFIDRIAAADHEPPDSAGEAGTAKGPALPTGSSHGPGDPLLRSAIVPSVAEDVGKAAYLGAAGFQCVGCVASLLEAGLPPGQGLDSCGVYAVTTPPYYVPEYIGPEPALAEGNVLAPWPVGRLARKWVPDAEVVYYGLAGRDRPRSLRRRLMDLLRHAQGDTTGNGPHKGGEIIWQLTGWRQFSVWAYATPGPAVPRLTEMALLQAFCATYGRPPYGNRQG